MSLRKTPDFLELCPHLQSEWTRLPSEGDSHRILYQHSYSMDQSEAMGLTSVSMKEIDIYSSREAYSFPACPRIYKYIIEQNKHEGNQLLFDISLLV